MSILNNKLIINWAEISIGTFIISDCAQNIFFINAMYEKVS